jgi:hypothetical protein
MMYYLRTFPNNNPLVARWIRAAVLGAARNLGGYHIRIIRNSHRFEHFANSHVVAATRSIELRAGARCCFFVDGRRLDYRLILRTRSPGVLPSSSTTTTLSEYRFGQDVNSGLQVLPNNSGKLRHVRRDPSRLVFAGQLPRRPLPAAFAALAAIRRASAGCTPGAAPL